MIEHYNQYGFFTIILILEFSIVIIFIIIITILHRYYEIKRKKTTKIQNEIKTILYEKLSNNSKDINFNIPELYKKPKYLVPVIEIIDERIYTQKWKKLKENIFKEMLFPFAIKYYKAFFWVNRNWAARIFAIEIQEKYEKYILTLLQDKHPLIRLQAITPAVELQTYNAIYTIITMMSKENKITSYLYRDSLLKSTSNTFRIIKEILTVEQNEKKRIACLEVFTHRTDVAIFKIIKNDINSKNIELRLIALKILSNYPNQLAIKELIKALDDENWEIRSTSAISLGRLGVKKIIPKLIYLLSDHVWLVRYNAALALKSMGNEGLNALENIDPEIDKYAHEIAQFVYSSAQ